jgi:hypothetical protein
MALLRQDWQLVGQERQVAVALRYWLLRQLVQVAGAEGRQRTQLELQLKHCMFERTRPMGQPAQLKVKLQLRAGAQLCRAEALKV